jgi:hypothetical protein
MVKYICEICDASYGTAAKAEACEQKPIIGDSFKPGLVLKDGERDNRHVVIYEKGKIAAGSHARLYSVVSIWLVANNSSVGLNGDFDVNSELDEGALEKLTREQFKRIKPVLQKELRDANRGFEKIKLSYLVAEPAVK